MIFKFCNRDWSLEEKDDFIKNLRPILLRDKTIEAVPQFIEDKVVGWTIKPRYE